MANKKQFGVRLSEARIEKLKRVAEQRDTTATHLIELWIDRLEEKPSQRDGALDPGFW
jgi:hypothetical protein